MLRCSHVSFWLLKTGSFGVALDQPFLLLLEFFFLRDINTPRVFIRAWA